jgi:cytochrome c oxidase subunit IV
MSDSTDITETAEAIAEAEAEAQSDRPVAERHDAHAGAGDHTWPDRKYIQLAAVLAIITALEVYASYADWLGPAFIPSLIIMMVIKFAAVVLFFMHLKFDSPIFGWLFYSGLFLAVGVYVGFLLTFQFFQR